MLLGKLGRFVAMRMLKMFTSLPQKEEDHATIGTVMIMGEACQNPWKQLSYTWVGEGPEPKRTQSIVSFPMYYYFWLKNYPNLEVRSRAEDVCTFC